MKTAGLCKECGASLQNGPEQVCPKCLTKIRLMNEIGAALPETVVVTESRILGDSTRRLASTGPEAPQRFGRYQIVRPLGQGGMGAVYEAEEIDSGRRVALKSLVHSLDSPEARQRFLREGRLAASVNHPNVVYIYGT